MNTHVIVLFKVLLALSFRLFATDVDENFAERIPLVDMAAESDESELLREYCFQLAGSILIVSGLTGACVGTLMAGAANCNVVDELCKAGIGMASTFGILSLSGAASYLYGCYDARQAGALQIQEPD